MPEYLAPGVYVEEIDTGSKPIEGVSTSTTGMVGITERGPVDVPIFVTSYGDFVRWFGERLNIRDFAADNGRRSHCFLPHAVEGFFTNGGKRLYVVRVLDPAGALPATFTLHNQGTNQSGTTLLLRAAAELSGTLATEPIYVMNVAAVLPNTGTLQDGDRIRIGNGSRAEYRLVAQIGQAGDPAPLAPNHVALNFPLSRTHAEAATVHHIPRTLIALPVATLSLDDDVDRGSETVVITGDPQDVAVVDLNLNPDMLLEIGGQFNGEHRFVTAVTPMDATRVRVRLDSPLATGYTAVTAVTPLDGAAAHVAGGDDSLRVAARAGEVIAYVEDRAGVFDVRTELVIFNRANIGHREARRMGELHLFTLSAGAYGLYQSSTLVEAVTLADDDRQVTVINSNILITVDDVALLSAGDRLRVGQGANLEEVVIDAVNATTRDLTLRAPGLTHAHVNNEPAVPLFSLKELTAEARAGASVIAVGNRVSLAVGDVIRIGVAPNEEYATIAALPDPSPGGMPPNAGTVVLAHPLNRTLPRATPVRRQDAPVLNLARPATVAALDLAAGGANLVVSDGNSYAVGDYVRLTTPENQVSYHRLTDVDLLDARPVALDEALTRAHQAGSPVVERGTLITVQALDAGAWGDRLRISVEDERSGLVSRTFITSIVDATHIRLASAAGVEAGAVLELLNPLNNNVVGEHLKVVRLERSSNTITLAAPGLSAAQQAAETAAVAAATHLNVRSREFRLTVRLLRQPDPALPSRNTMVIREEMFRQLSMDPRHSRYFQTIIGDINGRLRLADRRPEGESWYIRVRDVAQDLAEPNRTTTLESIRLGPETLTDILPNGVPRPARHALSGGNDSINTVTDDHYIGQDDPEPENRTGLHSLRNEDEISLVAIPGQTNPAIQQALIDHCELMRYRFSVLDGERPPNDSLMDVQAQRQQFDTKYAALYHPWLLIPDPFPVNLNQIRNYPIPPSGHMLGIYARTDIERGVHKAPANEVVRGILGLQRILNKEEHDILNPYPVNINVIRDFRRNNRGIRVWGGRVITSDSDWKYVNVRRLLIFIEHSIDRGLQWVVFEPNAEPLWARVRRTIANFLTVVWRNGALEGVKKEEAFFVKCDRTTMTQTDIDSGRLICIIGVAPVKPAEFVIIRIGLWTAHAED